MKKALPFLLCLCLLALQGCFPTGKPNVPPGTASSAASGAASEATPSAVDKTLDSNLIVKAPVRAAEAKTLKSVNAALKSFDAEGCKSYFLKGKTISQHNESKTPMFPEHKNQYYTCSDDSSLNVNFGEVRYITEYYNKREYDAAIQSTSYFLRPDIHQIFKQTELEQLDKAAAVETVRKAVQAVGLTPSGAPDVIALDLQSLQSTWEDFIDKKGNHPPKWEKKDEAYAVIFRAELNGTPVTNTGYRPASGGFGDVSGSRILGVVGKDGLLFFQAGGIYEPGTTIQDGIAPISLSGALEQIKTKYRNVLLTDPVTITDIALEYVPQIKKSGSDFVFELLPAWVFTANQTTTTQDAKGTTKVNASFPIYILADSGQELRIGGIA